MGFNNHFADGDIQKALKPQQMWNNSMLYQESRSIPISAVQANSEHIDYFSLLYTETVYSCWVLHKHLLNQ